MSRSRRPDLSARPRLFVIWSQRLAGDALRSALRMNGFDVADQDPAETDPVRAVGDQRPEVIIVDIDPPNEVRNSEVLLILEAFPSVKILAVSTGTDSLTSRSAAAAGLQGCLRKDAALSHVIVSINAVMNGQRVFASCPVIPARREAPQMTDEEQLGALLAMHITPRERDVLALLAEAAPMEEIAERLSITRSTVRTYLNSVFTKLQVHTRYQAVAAAIRYGVVRAPGRFRKPPVQSPEPIGTR